MHSTRSSQFASAPVLWLAVCFAFGIAVAAHIPFSLTVAVPLCLVLAVGAFITKEHVFATVLIFTAFVLAGSIVETAAEASVSPERIRRLYDERQISFDEPVEITGIIKGSAEFSPEGFFALVDTDSVVLDGETQRASGKIRIFSPTIPVELAEQLQPHDLTDGTRVRFTCELKRDDEFRNPGGLSRRNVLDWQGIDATCSIKGPLAMTIVERMEASSLTTPIYRFRESLIARFRELFSPQVSGVMIASLLGNKYFLDKQTGDIFREGGTFHILVISGLHITFIGGLAALFVGLFTKRKLVQFLIVCIFLWLYTIAVGGDIPVVRASLMFTVLWFSYVIHRNGSLANALGVCGLILLAWRPGDLFTPSFQLTFVSVGAIVIAGFPLISKLREIGAWMPSRRHPFPANVPEWLKWFCETLYWNEKVWMIESERNVWSANLFKMPGLKKAGGTLVQRTLAYLVEGVLISAVVQAAMLPLVVHYFHRVTPASIPLNLWTGVIIALESFAALFAVAISYISYTLALPLIRATEFLNWLMVLPGGLTKLGWLSFRVPIYRAWEFELYAAFLILAAFIGLAVFVWDPFAVGVKRTFFTRVNVVPASIAAFVLGAIIVFHPFSSPGPDGRLHVEFLDVGQGDSIFITFPNGETMLIDGGGRRSFDDDGGDTFEPDVPSIGEMVVSEFLWQKGYSTVDRIVATHADADHIQGLSDVARNFRVGEAWLGNAVSQDRDQLELAAILSQKNVPVKAVVRGDRFEIGGVSIEVLNPGQTFVTTTENDRSVVLRITFGERSFLFTGDAERAVETELVNEGGLHADVVKVGHHGSKTSSIEAFVEAARPQFAVIPVGRQSPFHHPNKDVVERWTRSGAKVMTTGEYGTLRFSTDGNEFWVSSYVPK